MKTVLKDAKITVQDLRIRFVRPDVAIVHETHEMSGMRNDKGETMPPHQELSIRVMVKEQDKWLIVPLSLLQIEQVMRFLFIAWV
jgi:hypothetical protein